MAQDTTSGRSAARCQGDNGGLTLSPDFCASIFAANLGHVHHLVVAPDGEVYANTWSGRYFPNSPPPPGGFLLALKDTKGTGRADVIQRFGMTVEKGGTGGSGIALYDGGLYANENDRILRYELVPGSLPSQPPRVVVSGLPLTGDHPMHPFVIDGKGSLFIDLGSATNACQEKNRIAGSRGLAPCTEKQTRAGTWWYDANKTGQVFSPSQRYASGIRNGEAFAFDAEGRLFVTQHGRDQLFQNWPHLYTAEQSAALPAEELLQLTSADSWIGWHFPEADWRVRPLLSASRITASFAAISENTGRPRFVSLRGFRAKPHFPSKQVTNDQDCFGVYGILEIAIEARSSS
jgi:glucose/arabinose dehydrogenase